MAQHQNTPQFIKQVPWYALKEGKEGKTGSFIQPKQQKTQLQQWYDRGSKGYQASTYRKGACQNCGAMGHSKKECTQRPRKITAKFSVKNIAPDDIQKNIDLDWEGKRDRWNGFNAQMYKQVIKQHEQYEQIRKRAKKEQGEQDVDGQFINSADPLQLGKLPTKQAKNKRFQGLGGVRNRDDYAKYLINLDVNSDHYDPKSRSMKSYDNPAAHLDNLEVIGQRDQLINQDRFASQQVELHNSQLSTIALPTLTQKIYKKIKQNNQSASSLNKSKQIIRKYGEITGQGPLQVIEEDDEFVNHRQIKTIAKSRYEEDVLINDHISVWGSWYNKLLGWGYSCCHSTQKHSYCLGNKGKQKALAAELKIKASRLRDLQQLQEASKNIDPVDQKVEKAQNGQNKNQDK